MRLEALSQFIVPLMFLAIWALTSLLNRDAQPLPQRPVRPGPRPDPGPGGAAAGMHGGSFSTDVRSEGSPSSAAPPSSPRRPGIDPNDPRTAERPARAPVRPAQGRTGGGKTRDPDVFVIDDELVFVDPVTRRQIGSTPLPTGTSGQRPSPRPAVARKPSRSRRPESPADRGRRSEPETQRVLSEQVSQSMAENRGVPMSLSPLTSGLTSLTSPSLGNAMSAAATVTSNDAPPSLSALQVSKMITDRGRLREMALLNELLGPPVSMRRSHRIR
ncbi:hypothetical protein [Paludisphaera mucosa]|uniref:Uncharacterized protein n=1 Tax=Paludisphaera mucosa TaxID=3030827 RepID=A0ABT6F5X7_9BACT|nr:hypothetical protein [Paludisphaera mucosa]MDG3002993.1 hypothetical protein [Paludisphaera mucosa]